MFSVPVVVRALVAAPKKMEVTELDALPFAILAWKLLHGNDLLGSVVCGHLPWKHSSPSTHGAENAAEYLTTVNPEVAT